MRRLIAIAAALSLVGCTAAQAPAPGTPPPVAAAPDRGDAILAVAGTAAAIADALDVAPPSSVVTTPIPAQAVRVAYLSFEGTLDVIDAFVASGQIVPGSPDALALKRAILATKDGLTAASAAQRASNARSYTAALRKAEVALAAVRSALTR